MSTSKPGPVLPLPEDHLQEEERAELSVGPTPLDWVTLVLAAAARRKLVAVIVFLLGVSATVAFYAGRTPLYRVEAKILAQRQLALPSIVQRSVIDEEPTRSARELVHRRENLLNLIKQANLPVASAAEPGERNQWLRLSPLSAPGTEGEDDPLNALVRRLDRVLRVTTEEGTVTIGIDWPHPEQAYHLVESAQQNFLEARHVQEITALAEVISLLEVRVSMLREQMEGVIEEVQGELSREPSAARASGSPRAETDEEVVKLRSTLEGKERALVDLEDMRRRRLAELQTQLDQMRSVYSDEFPGVVSLRQEILSLSKESPQIAALRAEAEQLRKDYSTRVAAERRQSASTPSSTRSPRPLDSTSVEQNERVREARAQYQQMLDRLNSARVDFDTARAAFKHRYKVIWPAQLSTKPVSPNPLKVFGAGLLAALLLALLAAAAPDLRSGVLLQRWQLERALALPVLGRVRRHAPGAASSRRRSGRIRRASQLEEDHELPVLAELGRDPR
jgi:uncharacterized protein involved in exopolysaccharide biosynthesis